MKFTRDPGTARFQVLRRSIYGYADDRYHTTFHWPGSWEVIRQPPHEDSTVCNGVFAVSPGRRYVCAFTTDKELLVWESSTKRLVGRTSLPELAGLDQDILLIAETGFAPGGAEFAAILGTPGQTWLLNWHWASGVITAAHEVNTPWVGSRDPQKQHSRELQFLENKRGWLTEFGSVIVDRTTGKRRQAFDADRAYKADIFIHSTPRLSAGNRALAIWQNPADLFHQEIRTFDLVIE